MSAEEKTSILKAHQDLPVFDSKHRWLIGILVFLLIGLSLAHLHGFSIGAWHDLIDDSPNEELIFGRPQGIRGDDYASHIPFYLSQISHQPPFPVRNSLIGDGHSMLVNFPMPVTHWATFFRPETWGYFAGADFGMAWMWWFRFLALFYSFFLVCRLVSSNRFGLSIFAALAFVFSPFFQFWSFYFEPAATFALLALVSGISLLSASSSAKTALFALLFFWSSTAFVLNLYPPMQISLGYLCLFLFAGFIGRRIRVPMGTAISAKRWALLFSALIAAAFCFWFFYLENREAFQAVMNTVYPGSRFSAGGGIAFDHFFSNFFLPWHKSEPWPFYMNICESSSFFFFFPLIGLCLFWRRIVRRTKIDPVALALLGYLAFITAWMLWGLPAPLAKITLLDRVLENRAMAGAGAANFLLLVSYLSSDSSKRLERFESIVLGCLWLLFLVYLASHLMRKFPMLERPEVIVKALGFALIGFLFLLRNKFAMPLLAALSIFLTSTFNPISRGGAAFFLENPLSRKILELNRQKNGKSVWVSVNDVETPNLFRILGVKAITGMNFYPPFETWKILDPHSKFFEAYNRFGYIHFSFDPKPSTFQVEGLYSVVKARFHPENERFMMLNFDFLLFTGDPPSELKASNRYKEIDSFLKYHIYEVVKSQRASP